MKETKYETDLILSHKEQVMLQQFRALSDSDREEVEKKIYEIAAKCAGLSE